MIKHLILASSLATVVAFGAMPTATAQIDNDFEAKPYAITFNGSFYPANLDEVSYPFNAASTNRNGECLLNVMTDETGEIAAMTILRCTNDIFENEARDLIKRQALTGPVPAKLTAHALRITWDIGAAAEPTPVQLVVR